MGDRAVWLLRSQLTSARMLRFFIIGVVTSALYALLVAGLVGFVTETIAAAVAYLFLLPANFLGHRRATFQSSANKWQELLRYLMVHGLTLVACVAVMQVVTMGLGGSHWAGSTAIIVIAPVLNFAMMQYWVFSVRSH